MTSWERSYSKQVSSRVTEFTWLEKLNMLQVPLQCSLSGSVDKLPQKIRRLNGSGEGGTNLERLVDLGEEIGRMVGEEAEESREDGLRVLWRHSPHQAHRRFHFPALHVPSSLVFYDRSSFLLLLYFHRPFGLSCKNTPIGASPEGRYQLGRHSGFLVCPPATPSAFASLSLSLLFKSWKVSFFKFWCKK